MLYFEEFGFALNKQKQYNKMKDLIFLIIYRKFNIKKSSSLDKRKQIYLITFVFQENFVTKLVCALLISLTITNKLEMALQFKKTF